MHSPFSHYWGGGQLVEENRKLREELHQLQNRLALFEEEPISTEAPSATEDPLKSLYKLPMDIMANVQKMKWAHLSFFLCCSAERVESIFTMFDIDSSGEIDAKEFQLLAFQLGETLSSEEVDFLFLFFSLSIFNCSY